MHHARCHFFCAFKKIAAPLAKYRQRIIHTIAVQLAKRTLQHRSNVVRLRVSRVPGLRELRQLTEILHQWMTLARQPGAGQQRLANQRAGMRQQALGQFRMEQRLAEEVGNNGAGRLDHAHLARRQWRAGQGSTGENHRILQRIGSTQGSGEAFVIDLGLPRRRLAIQADKQLGEAAVAIGHSCPRALRSRSHSRSQCRAGHGSHLQCLMSRSES